MADSPLVHLYQGGGVMYASLNRPEVKNAMNFAMVDELLAAFDTAEADDSVRILVLRGAGGVFCAGGDIKDMALSGKEPADIAAANRRFGALLERAQAFGKLLVVVAEGAALGGGFGLVCVSDIAVVEASCRFGMPEVTLGIVPAQIAPFVRTRIGLTETRRLALTGALIDGKDARKLGLVHYAEEGREGTDRRLKKILKQALKAAPEATAATKALIANCGDTVTPETLDRAAQAFTSALLSEEGREGTRAFAEKRPAAWMEMPT